MNDSRQARMEAAAWIAKLQAPDRSPELEAGFRRWLAESEQHRAAFDMANEVWGDLAAIPKAEHPIRVTFRRSRLRSSSAKDPGDSSPRSFGSLAAGRARRFLPASAAIVGIAIAVATWILHEPSLTTAVGERRVVTLEDGSEVTLNTDTRVESDFSATRRRLRLERGEVFFKVAKDADRPFVVSIGEHDVVALGTAFVARRDHGTVAVTLVEGKVSVSTGTRGVTAGDPDRLMLMPGERVVFTSDESPRLDRPKLEKVTAWRRGQLDLDRTPLADAIAEMNRYSDIQIVLDRERSVADRGARIDPGDIRITGIFRVGEPEEFARAIAATYGMRLTEDQRRLVLSDTPP